MDHLPFYTRQDRLKAGTHSLRHSYFVQVFGEYRIQHVAKDKLNALIEEHDLVPFDHPKSVADHVKRGKTGNYEFNEMEADLGGWPYFLTRQLLYTSHPYSTMNLKILDAESAAVRKLYEDAIDQVDLVNRPDGFGGEHHDQPTSHITQSCHASLINEVFDTSDFGVLKPYTLAEGHIIKPEQSSFTPPEIDWGLG